MADTLSRLVQFGMGADSRRRLGLSVCANCGEVTSRQDDE